MHEENVTSFREQVHNAREERMSRLPALPLSSALLLLSYLCLCMTYLPMWDSPVFATVVLMLTAVMAALTWRSPWVIGMIALPAVLLAGVTGSVSAAAIPIALLCSIAYGAFLLLNAPPAAVALTLLASPVLSVLLTGEWESVMLSLVGVPAMLALSFSLRRGWLRVRTICRVTVILAVSAAAVGVAYLLLRKGVGAFHDISHAISAARNALAECLAAWETGSGDLAGRVVLEGMEVALASALFNILPGVFLAMLLIFSYLVNLICLTLFRTYERTKYLSARVFVVAISLPSSILFLAAYLLQLTVGEYAGVQAQFAAVVAENLYLILLPAMCLAGSIHCLGAFLISSHRGMLLIGAILLIALAPGAALTALSLFGAVGIIWRTLWRHFRRRPKSE